MSPKMAITMGIDTIMRADKIVRMAWGEEKADVIRKVVEGQITDQVPATALQEHHNIEVVIDEIEPPESSRARLRRGWSAPASGRPSSRARRSSGCAAWWGSRF